MDSEVLVETSWKRRGGRISFTHNPKNGHGDKQGEDFAGVTLQGYTFCEAFQIKTSDNGNTLGIVLPLHKPLPPDISGKISGWMRAEIEEHLRKHPHVRCMLFVAKPGRHATEEQVIRDIWTETESIFHQLGRKHHKKGGKIRPLAFLCGACYNRR